MEKTNERRQAAERESANGRDGAFMEKRFKKILISQKLMLTCW